MNLFLVKIKFQNLLHSKHNNLVWLDVELNT